MSQLKNRLERRQVLHTLIMFTLSVMVCICSPIVLRVWNALLRPKTILVNGTEVVVHDELDRNEYEETDFAVVSGRQVFQSGAYRTGIDVSSHQGEIDWAQVAGDGIDFAMLRAGYRGFGEEGILNEDACFQQNAEQAVENGLDIGVYFFSQATTVDEALEEADFLLEIIQNVEITLPVAYDWEVIHPDLSGEDGARTDDVDMETATACAAAFCQRIAEAGYQPLLYCNDEVGYFLLDLTQLQDHPLWYAAYHVSWPNYYYRLDLWQYTDSGTVAGIEGNVDLNLWMIDGEPEEAGGSNGAESNTSSIIS